MTATRHGDSRPQGLGVSDIQRLGVLCRQALSQPPPPRAAAAPGAYPGLARESPSRIEPGAARVKRYCYHETFSTVSSAAVQITSDSATQRRARSLQLRLRRRTRMT
jgi:hypothetical protein